ncbi:helix-turn-helix domain-containing protein [Sodalis endosymbiont of Spalangia cameroni]|uniref:helix-turn-helix domain-containing protein n=1 Tax=Sodalis praecaptivus TaxID=1239307 RepID=UPI0031F9A2F9
MSAPYKQKTVYDEKICKQFFLASGINRFGDRLKEAMKQRGITSNVMMAALCDMSDTVIRNYMNSKTYPTLDRLATLACVLECSPEWLLVGDKAKSALSPEEQISLYQDINPNKNSDLELILKKLSSFQQEALLEAILQFGVNGILSALGKTELVTEFSRLPDEEKERLMRLHENIKKGAPDGSEVASEESLASKRKRAV